MGHAATMFQARAGYASGALCFSGTKIRVETLFNYLRDGGTIDEFLDEFEGAVNLEQAVCAVRDRREGVRPASRAARHHPLRLEALTMRTYTAVVERCPATRLYVGYVPGLPGAHSQGETLEELNDNLREVIALVLEDGEPEMDGEYVGTQTVMVDVPAVAGAT